MKKIIIMTDSSPDISPEFKKSAEIFQFPFQITFNEETFPDNGESDALEFFAKVNQTKTQDVPKTAAPSPEVFLSLIESQLKGNDYYLVYFGIGSRYSASLNYFQVALNNLAPEYKNRTFFIDTWQIASGVTMLIKKAVEIKDQVQSIDEFLNFLNEYKKGMVIEFIAKDLSYLKRSGRVSGMQSLIGSILQIKPIFRSERNDILPRKSIGTHIKALENVFNVFFEHYQKGEIDEKTVAIATIEDERFAKYLEDKISEHCPDITTVRSFLTKTICVHSGANITGICYHVKKAS